MWDQIINIYLNELLNTTTKDSRINNRKKKCFTIIFFLKMNNLHFIPNNILKNFLKS